MSQGRNRQDSPPPGTSGVIDIGGGFKASYMDLRTSGRILNDYGAGVDENKTYWVRHSIAGAQILGPVLEVVEGNPDA